MSHKDPILSLCCALLVGILSLTPDRALSQDRPTLALPPATPSSPIVIRVKQVRTTGAGIGERVLVEIQNLAEAIEKDGINPRKLALYLDGRVMLGIYAEPVGDNLLEFTLERTEKSKQAWLPLLGSPTSAVRNVSLSVGYEDKGQIVAADPNSPPILKLRVFHLGWFVACTIGVAVLLALFVWLARSSDILRDSTVVGLSADQRRPYSLARFQMAVWLFLVMAAFLFIYLITGDYNTITQEVLVLIGIGTGTALGAAAVDVSKRNAANREKEKQDGLAAEAATLTRQIQAIQGGLQAAPQLASPFKELTVKLAETNAREAETAMSVHRASSTGFIQDPSNTFLLDLLSDANGVTFHRFQMFAWTVVLAFLFCVGVYKNLAMPEFGTTLLALMGISSGTYLGFKIPEAQSK